MARHRGRAPRWPGHRHLARRRAPRPRRRVATASSRTTPGTGSARRCTSRRTSRTSGVRARAPSWSRASPWPSSRCSRSAARSTDAPRGRLDRRHRRRRWAAHFEHTFTITSTGTWVLTALDGGEARAGAGARAVRGSADSADARVLRMGRAGGSIPSPRSRQHELCSGAVGRPLTAEETPDDFASPHRRSSPWRSPPLEWTITIVATCAVLLFDVIVIARDPHEPSFRECAIALSVYIGAAVAFGAWIWASHGHDMGIAVLHGLADGVLAVDRQPVRLHHHHVRVAGAEAVPAGGADGRHHPRADLPRHLHRARLPADRATSAGSSTSSARSWSTPRSTPGQELPQPRGRAPRGEPDRPVRPGATSTSARSTTG